MNHALELAGQAALAAGALLLVVAAAGLHLLPDALSRQHAGTKAVTLALGLICVGAALMSQDTAWTLRLCLLLILLGVTLPISSHMLARAAVREQSLQEVAARAPVIEPDGEPGSRAGDGRDDQRADGGRTRDGSA